MSEHPSWWDDLPYAAARIHDWPKLLYWARAARAGGRQIVLANGVFDLLHPGHLLKLSKARRLASDFLIVSLDTDNEVRFQKGRPPALSWRERAAIVASLTGVNAVTWHGEGVWALKVLAGLLAPCRWVRRDDAPEGEVAGVESIRLERQGSWASSSLRGK